MKNALLAVLGGGMTLLACGIWSGCSDAAGGNEGPGQERESGGASAADGKGGARSAGAAGRAGSNRGAGAGGASEVSDEDEPASGSGGGAAGKASGGGGKGGSGDKSGAGGRGGGGGKGGTSSGASGSTAVRGAAGAKVGTGGSGSAGSATGGAGTTVTAPANGVPTLLGDVTFSKPSQSFKDQIQIELGTSVEGAEIRYTVDGKLPTTSSTAYAGTAVTLKATTQLRAQTFVDGRASGAVSTAIYIARTIDLTSDLPIVVVDGYGKGKPCDKKVDLDAAVMIWEPVNGVASMTSLPTLAARAGYHVRGQSSASFPQSPYKIEFWDNNNKDLDYPVLGMPADSDWALIAPYYDRTLIRNPFVYALGKEMGMVVPRTAFAEVYVNDANHPINDENYQGIYWVSETIKNNSVRTNLKQLKEADTDAAKISGGYIFKFDQMAAEEPKIVCTGSDVIPPFGSGGGAMGGGAMGGGAVGGGAMGGGAMGGGAVGGGATATNKNTCPMQMGSYTTPKGSGGTCWTDLEVVDPDPLNTEQKAWLTNYIQQFHDSLHKSPIGDYATYIDVSSFINYFIISALAVRLPR